MNNTRTGQASTYRQTLCRRCGFIVNYFLHTHCTAEVRPRARGQGTHPLRFLFVFSIRLIEITIFSLSLSLDFNRVRFVFPLPRHVRLIRARNAQRDFCAAHANGSGSSRTVSGSGDPWPVHCELKCIEQAVPVHREVESACRMSRAAVGIISRDWCV